MRESTFTIRVDDHLKEAFTEAARVSDRTGAQLIRDFMREYVQTAREKAEFFPTMRCTNAPDSGANACLQPMECALDEPRLV